jgi:hypothetical protein
MVRLLETSGGHCNVSAQARLDNVEERAQGGRRSPRLGRRCSFALKFEGRKRVHRADEYMAAIAAARVVRHLERAGFVVLKKPPLGGHPAVGHEFEPSR